MANLDSGLSISSIISFLKITLRIITTWFSIVRCQEPFLDGYQRSNLIIMKYAYKKTAEIMKSITAKRTHNYPEFTIAELKTIFTSSTFANTRDFKITPQTPIKSSQSHSYSSNLNRPQSDQNLYTFVAVYKVGFYCDGYLQLKAKK